MDHAFQSLTRDFKRRVQTAARGVGLEIRRVKTVPAPPELCDDPRETVHRRNCHDLVVFNCPLAHCVEMNGMSFSRHGWHPLVQAALEYASGAVRRYEGSCLEKYYAVWQPRNGREALIGASAGPARLEAYPSYVRHLPWSTRTPEESTAYMERVIEIENRSFGDQPLSPFHGYGLQGPVSPEKGRIEFRRVTGLVDSIRGVGYDRSRGDVTIDVLHRRGEFRYIVVHGHHRLAALAALGREHVPALPEQLVDVSECAHWPAVYHGFWTQGEALSYCDHLFTFDSRAWARRHSLA